MLINFSFSSLTRCLPRCLRWIACAVLLALFPLNAFGASFEEAEKQEIEQIIENYLLENPELMLRVFERLEQVQKDEETRRDLTALTIQRKGLERDGYSFVAGNPDGDITIIEFFDYRCTYCKRTIPEVDAVLAKDPNVRLVLKEFPILGPDSMFASRAAIASMKQDKYKAFHDALFAHRTALNKSAVLKIAAKSGINMALLKADMEDPSIRKQIAKNIGIAESLRIEGTPTFIVGDTVLRGAVERDRLFAEIAAARQQCQSC